MVECFLVGDFGGTNVRLALASHGRLMRVWHEKTSVFPDPGDAIATFLAMCRDQPPSRAILAVAAPIVGDEVRLVNSTWIVSTPRLEARFGFKFRLENDFSAIAKAIPFLISSGDGMPQCPGDYCAIGSPLQASGNIAVIGPGTGLGVAGLITTPAGWIDLPGEGGHVTMAARTAEEREILNMIRNDNDHLSAERVLSGPGLVRLYEACCRQADVVPLGLSPPDVTKAMRDFDGGIHSTIATRAFEIFCAMLGVVAGNLALTLGATGGVYIAGGILRGAHRELSDSSFRNRFEDKGRMHGYLAKIPAYLVLHQYPAMLGLANSR